MAGFKLKFHKELTTTDPKNHPVLIVGQLKHLNQLKYADIKCKLEPRVSEETYVAAISTLHPSPTDTCSLYLNLATVAALPLKCSRHNTPSRAHALTRLVKNCMVGANESIVIVCEKTELYASSCAVARAFPMYTRKSVGANGPSTPVPLPKRESGISNEGGVTVNVEFIVMPSSSSAGSNVELNGFPIAAEITDEEIQLIEDSAHAIRLTAAIVDAPCNEMNVDDFIEEVKKVGEVLELTPTIIRGEELRDRGFGGIWGVGKAARVGPALAILSYTPPGAHNTVAWVGKGIVYDTGGLSLKGKTAMPGMKRDCGGAAAILGAFYATIKSGFTENLHAVFCLAENAVGPDATRPDDIHTLYSGRTVEINNTDAEGRLVLADGVAYAHHNLKANVILDMATLTGAQGIATGKYHGAVLTNSSEWEEMCVKSGSVSGDLVFPVPYSPELHFSEFTSVFADMKNSVADRCNAQVSCAGLFIGAHLGFDFPGTWIHIDMATPVSIGERATGYGVALLCTLFGHFTKKRLLHAISPFKAYVSEIENACKKQRIN